MSALSVPQRDHSGHGTEGYPQEGVLGIPAGAMYLGVPALLAVLGGILSLGLTSRLPIFLAWMVALPVAGWSYYRRTRGAG
ncbi:hypothetical protein [Herbidospora cretacea]|uniref:hypothetical protein n=1 Tax=Herbidospora cretacea TaxID=28444 RepID=UPI000AB36CDA|nr:hypothetical protein [Herbidospora cretacea]